MDARLSDMGLDREIAWPAGQHQHAGPGFSAAEALSATRSQSGGVVVEYLPVERRISLKVV